MSTYIVWQSEVGILNPTPKEAHGQLPDGADFPMRRAVEIAFKKVVGSFPTFQFSGWGKELPEEQQAVVENRLPNKEIMIAELEKQARIYGYTLVKVQS